MSSGVKKVGWLLTTGLLLAACGGGAPTAAPASSAAPAPTTAKPVASTATSASAQPAASSAASVAASAAAGGGLAMKSAYTTTSATMTPQWVTKDAGYFDQQGLNVTLTRIEAGAPILAAVTGGDAPIAFMGAQQIVESDLQGAQLVITAGFVDTLGQQIYAVPSIQKPEDLKGKALGVTNFGAITHVAGQVAAQQLGLKGQINFIATGGPPQTLAAIKSGKVQGGIFSPPQSFQAEQEGLHMVYDVSKSGVKSQTAAIGTTRQYVKDHPDVVERYIKAALVGVHRAITDKQQAVASIRKYGGVDDADLAAKTYDYYKDEWNRDGMPTLPGIQQNLDVASDTIPAAKTAKPEQFVDTSIIEKIKASGYIDQLWKS